VSRGVVNIAARAAFLLLTCLGFILIGFFLPMAPIVRNLIGSAVFAGSLASAGAIIGMYVSDAVLARIEPQEPAAPASAKPKEADEKTRRRV
jgi:hypothetical protein